MSGTQSDQTQAARGVPAEAVIDRLQSEIGELHKRVAILEVQLEQAWQTRQEMDDSRTQRSGGAFGGSAESR